MTEDFVPPTCSLNAPRSGSIVRGLVSVAASAWDDVAIRRVIFFANGMPIGEADFPPYKILWNSTTVRNGPVTIEAHAVDTSDNQSLPSMAQVTVANIADTSPPVPMVTYPDDGETIEGVITIKGVATDNVGVTALHILIDGRKVHSVTDAARIKYDWDTTQTAPGEHTISVIAEDASGNKGTASVRVKK